MKDTLLSLLFMIFANLIFAQNFLEDDLEKIIKPELNSGIPTSLKNNFQNFEDNKTFESVEGLSKDSYVTTNARLSTIEIEKENIGRLVIYAKLFNTKDSILYNPFHKRKGKITIRAYRDNNIINELTSVTNFDEDIFQQIHFNTLKANIGKIKISFETTNDLFILEKFKLASYNSSGINHYLELERSENEILNLSGNLENEALKLKKKYQEQIKGIQYSHSTLSDLIIGKKFENIAIVQSNSLNPFNNKKFTDHYNTILENASVAERAKLENLTKELKDNDFSNIALTLDNLFLGGKFSSVINLIDGLFKTNINLLDSDSKPLPIVKLDNFYYFKKESNKDNLKLFLVDEEPILNKIQLIKEENKAYKTYVNDIAGFMKEDIESLIQLNEYLANAEIIRSDFEELTWDILKRFTKNDKSLFIKETGIDFFEVGTELEKNFNPSELENISSLKEIRNESITSIKRLNELITKYGKVTSKIKTHYDLIYEIRPRQRKKHFDNIDKLPAVLKIDWKDKQDTIIEEYKKDDGLKKFLAETTGKE